jgi:DNA-binding Xre family transcriptional regulator
MEEILNRLADLILLEMVKKDCSMTCFAELCGIPRNEMGLIVNKKKKDVRLSVIWNICENSDIGFSDIFQIECAEEFNIENFILTNGKEKYEIKKLGRGDCSSAF